MYVYREYVGKDLQQRMMYTEISCGEQLVGNCSPITVTGGLFTGMRYYNEMDKHINARGFMIAPGVTKSDVL